MRKFQMTLSPPEDGGGSTNKNGTCTSSPSCLWLLHGFPDEQETGCVIVLSVCRNMIGDVWYDDVEVAQLPETNNASRRKMSAEEKCPAAEMAAVSLDAIKWINWQWNKNNNVQGRQQEAHVWAHEYMAT